MAARENQGYLIAVIILVLLSLVLALVAFLGVQRAYEQADAAKSAETKLAAHKAFVTAEENRSSALKAMIGIDEGNAQLESFIQNLKSASGSSSLSQDDRNIISGVLADVENAQEAYLGDIGAPVSPAGDGDAGKKSTYRERLDDLTALIDRLRKDYNIQVTQTDEADRDAKNKIAQMQQSLDSTVDEMEKLSQALADEKEASLVKEQTLKEQVDKGAKDLRVLTQVSEEAQQKDAESIRVLNNDIAKLTEDNKNLKIRLNRYESESFINADGQVVRVASSLNTIFIDIGSADGLTNNRTFAVYDSSVTDFENSAAKGSIEVVRVGEFRSEARITEQNTVDPILRGDHILTATWDPGFSVQIALAGRFDLDGDRYDDTERLIRMIERNGGVVVVSHDAEGNINGKMAPGVRYLVKGNKSLVGSEDDPNSGAILNAVRQLESAAEKNTVQVIDLQKLLNRMGVRAQPKTQQIDFPAGGFTPRQPGLIKPSTR
jgi:uncharacterized protein YlxP (DUF503 family)